jgi:hypothetical protein
MKLEQMLGFTPVTTNQFQMKIGKVDLTLCEIDVRKWVLTVMFATGEQVFKIQSGPDLVRALFNAGQAIGNNANTDNLYLENISNEEV